MNVHRLLIRQLAHHRRWSGLALAGLVTMTALAIVACGGGGTTPDNRVSALRPLSAEFMTRKAVAYSPYRTAANVAGLAGETIPEANIKQDLDLLVAAGFGLIRLFDSDDKVGKATLQVIRKYKLNLKVQLGVFLQSGNDSFNLGQIDRAVALANTYFDIVLAVSVGNENMVVWSFNKIDPTVMAGYIRKLRPQIAQPITSDDNYAFWAQSDARIADVVDFASLHTYTELDTVFVAEPGLFDWRQKAVPEAKRAAAMMDAATAEAHRQYDVARNNLDRLGRADIPITIGETGWNAVDLGALKFRAHPVNQKMYLDRLDAWAAQGRSGAGPKAVFYFEAFDEPWKQGDDKWGLFNVLRQARYAIKDLLPSSTWEPGTAALTAADAVYWKAPTVNAAITQDRVKLFSDAAATASEVVITGTTWDPFGGSTVVHAPGAAAPGDGSVGDVITIAAPANYGWGTLLHASSGASLNLSAFAATGALHFSVKTAYPGKIEIGIQTDSEDAGIQEAYLQIGSGEFGYCNTNAWCNVTIPMSAFVAANPKIDPRLMLLYFVIADRFEKTGKALGTTGLPTIAIDGIYWGK